MDNIGLLEPVLAPPRIFLFAFISVLITVSGYLINDYIDFDSDLANNKGLRLKSKSQLLTSYFLSVFIGFFLSLFMAYQIGKIYLSAIYLVAVALLYLYSTLWKQKVLIGNIVVSLFSSFVVLILLYAEKDQFLIITPESFLVLIQVGMFSLFAFCISMTREIIKDIEDVEGDRAVGYRTLPIVSGIGRAAGIAFLYSVFLLLTVVIWLTILLQMLSHTDVLLIGLTTIFLILPIAYLSSQLLIKFDQERASHLSKVCKWIMLSGLTFLLITESFFLSNI